MEWELGEILIYSTIGAALPYLAVFVQERSSAFLRRSCRRVLH
ncbi:MAG TPA: hypothetical protein VFK74_09940 [Azospira sp.]|nr:hypothetical protein [Azospira sp.]